MSVPMQLREYLAGLDYPISKEDLIRRVQETGADTGMLEKLRSLPVEQFTAPTDVDEALGLS